jgi:hypothetical protein
VDKLGPHVGTKRLIAYREGRLPETERDEIQEHLSLCSRCTGLLRELRDFEAAAAGAVEPGPESLREQAWDALSRRLPRAEPAVRPIATFPSRRRPVPAFVYAAAAALLLAAIGLAVWSTVQLRQERRHVAELEQRLKERESALAVAQQTLAETERQLQAASDRLRGREIQAPAPRDSREEELEERIAELTADLEKARRPPGSPGGRDRVVAGPRQIDLSAAPRFALRGQEAPAPLRSGESTSVRQADRITLAVDTAGHPVFPDYRFELQDADGKTLWSGRRPGKTLLGDAGTALAITGLAPGSYRLRMEGLSTDRTELIGEYRLDVKAE